MSAAVGLLEDEVRELVRRRGLDPSADAAAVRRLVDEVVSQGVGKVDVAVIEAAVGPDRGGG